MSRAWWWASRALAAASLALAGPTSSTLTFCGYTCTQDCSGHIAGYEWAARKRLLYRHQCGGNSRSFIEGCLAYVEGCKP